MEIVQMKKVSLVILDAEKKESLKQLKKAGVLHLETIEGNSADLTALRESSQEVDKALGILEEFPDIRHRILRFDFKEEHIPHLVVAAKILDLPHQFVFPHWTSLLFFFYYTAGCNKKQWAFVYFLRRACYNILS